MSSELYAVCSTWNEHWAHLVLGDWMNTFSSVDIIEMAILLAFTPWLVAAVPWQSVARPVWWTGRWMAIRRVLLMVISQVHSHVRHLYSILKRQNVPSCPDYQSWIWEKVPGIILGTWSVQSLRRHSTAPSFNLRPTWLSQLTAQQRVSQLLGTVLQRRQVTWQIALQIQITYSSQHLQLWRLTRLQMRLQITGPAPRIHATCHRTRTMQSQRARHQIPLLLVILERDFFE